MELFSGFRGRFAPSMRLTKTTTGKRKEQVIPLGGWGGDCRNEVRERSKRKLGKALLYLLHCVAKH